jgi:cyclin D7
MVELLSVACLSVASKFSETCTPTLHEIQVTLVNYCCCCCCSIYIYN